MESERLVLPSVYHSATRHSSRSLDKPQDENAVKRKTKCRRLHVTELKICHDELRSLWFHGELLFRPYLLHEQACKLRQHCPLCTTGNSIADDAHTEEDFVLLKEYMVIPQFITVIKRFRAARYGRVILKNREAMYTHCIGTESQNRKKKKLGQIGKRYQCGFKETHFTIIQTE